nr:EAL domain-containing protein [Thalassotalea sp. G2M2-11]
MQNCLQTALKKQELELYYQLKVHESNENIVGMEALLRWRNDDIGQVSPAQFIPLAEELGLIVDIDRWVLIQACKQRKHWYDEGVDCGAVSVNISALHFNHDLVYAVEQALSISDLPAHLLELEVTESCFIQNIENAQSMLKQINQLGVSLSIDDFGTGYSSLNYLSQLSLDTLKIDASFVANVPEDPRQCQIVKTIIAMANALDLAIIAEGVETKTQIDFLTEHGCHVYQGYYYSRPLSAHDTQIRYFS